MAERVSPRRRTTAVAVMAAAAVTAVTVAAAAAPATAQDMPPQFDFFGPRGPAFWGTLSPDWRACGSGMEQSPIDVLATPPVGPLPLEGVASQDDGAMLRPAGVANGATFACTAPGSCGIASWAGYTYDLVTVHVHVGVEHTMGGEVFPAELQLVHAADDGSALIAAVHLRVGEANVGLEKLLAAAEAVPSMATAGVATDTMVTLGDADWAALFPGTDGWCQYAGSLTTPPCTEGVTWAVSSAPRTASAAQLRRLSVALLNAGSVVLAKRPVQPLNGRTLTCYSSE